VPKRLDLFDDLLFIVQVRTVQCLLQMMQLQFIGLD